MKKSGMTLIVRSTTRILAGFIAIFGLYVALTGHISPGGGFAGGVILAAGALLTVLAFGRPFANRLINEGACHVWDAGGALVFLAVALCGYFAGSFFFNFIVDKGAPGRLWSGGAIWVSNLAIAVKVGAGLAGAFLALAAFRRVRASQGEGA